MKYTKTKHEHCLKITDHFTKVKIVKTVANDVSLALHHSTNFALTSNLLIFTND